MLSQNERAASAFIARRLRMIRLKRGLTIEQVASSIGVGPETYRKRERGFVVISIEFLLRCCLALNLDIRHFWFPQDVRAAVADGEVIRDLLIRWSRAEQPVSLAQVVELCAEAFDVSPAAIKVGMLHRKVTQARTAAAIIVSSTPHLQLTDLAPLVGRSTRNLLWLRKRAEKAGPEIWVKVEAIRAELEAL